jgi:hypothetical protein
MSVLLYLFNPNSLSDIKFTRIDNHKLAIFTDKRKKSSIGCLNENAIIVFGLISRKTDQERSLELPRSFSVPRTCLPAGRRRKVASG